MEAEILQTLKEIRGVFYVIAAIFFVGFSVLSINAFETRRDLKKTLKRSWNDEAIEYFETENYNALIEHCKSRENTHKNDANPFYWQARMYREKGEIEKAKEYFSKCSKMSPEIHQAFVAPYLENESQ